MLPVPMAKTDCENVSEKINPFYWFENTISDQRPLNDPLDGSDFVRCSIGDVSTRRLLVVIYMVVIALCFLAIVFLTIKGLLLFTFVTFE